MRHIGMAWRFTAILPFSISIIKDWLEHSSQQFEKVRRSGKKVYLWAATEERIDEIENAPCSLPVSIKDDSKLFYKALRQGISSCFQTSADGVYFYETYAPEKHEGYWQELKRIIKKNVGF